MSHSEQTSEPKFPDLEESTAVLSLAEEISDHSVAKLEPGKIVDGKFRVVRLLGRGGMSHVFLARDVDLGRRVALKTLKPRGDLNDVQFVEWIRLFRRDAAANARLNHPNIVTCHHFGVYGSVPFMVLEYVDGPTLATRLLQGPVDPTGVLAIARQLAVALQYVHEQGLVHRDIKPSNVIVQSDGTLKLLDFGVALLNVDRRILRQEFDRDERDLRQHIGESPWVAGTPRYMPPEALRGMEQDARVDIWSFGVLLYELLTGERPFSDREAILSEVAPAFDFPTDTPQSLRAVVQRCLEFAVNDRPASFDEVLEMLEEATPRPEVVRSRSLGPGFPLFVDDFIGRTAVFDELESAFGAGARVVSLVGPGGVGKTRASVEWTRRNSAWLGSVCFADLSETTDIDGIIRTVANAAEIPLSTKSLRETLIWGLSRRGRHVLVLDNCEQIVRPARDLVDSILKEAAGVQILVTSREPLGVGGERVVPLEPLGLESGSNLSEAAQLFVARAKSSAARWQLRDEERGPLEELVEQLDGLPLAIELAASRAEILPPIRMLERMQQRFAMLRSRSFDAPDRQATLAGALEWSWDLLENDERLVMCQLAQFEGSFGVDAIEAIVRCGTGRCWSLDIVENLVRKSLVRHDAEGGRFSLLKSVGEFVRSRHELPDAEWLNGADPEEWTAEQRKRFYSFFAKFGHRDRICALATTNDVGSVVAELPNLRAAIEFAENAGATQQVALIACAIIEAYDRGGPYADAVAVVDRVAALDGLDSELRCRLDLVSGSIFKRLGQFNRCEKVWKGALELAEELGDEGLVGSAHLKLGQVADRLGRLDDAEAHFERSLEVARRIGDVVLERNSIGNLGNTSIDRFEFEAAQERYLTAVRLSRDLNDERGRGVWLGNLGIVEFYRRDYESAAKYYLEALELARKVQDRTSEALWSSNVADCSLLLGRHDEAKRDYLAAMALARELGDRFQESICDGKLGQLEYGRDNLVKAKQHLRLALNASVELGNLYYEAAWRETLAKVHIKAGEFEAAESELMRAEDVAEEQRNESQRVTRRGWRGVCALERQEYVRAKQLIAPAVEQAVEEESCHEVVLWSAYLGLCEGGRSNLDAAVEALERAERALERSEPEMVQLDQFPKIALERLQGWVASMTARER